jgi:hypothetical protein
MSNSDTAALKYLVIVLLQRLEGLKPGLSEEMLAGVLADKEAASSSDAHANAVFDGAARILRLASPQIGISGTLSARVARGRCSS